jgi:hypothetical protein
MKETIEKNREDLEALAVSDLPAARIAKSLLDAAETEG